MLGEHPYLLLDYGGWERPNDFAGAPLVGQYFTFLEDYQYHAVGSMFYVRLEPERWDAYNEVDPGVELLVSAGTAQGNPLPAVPAVTREVHDRKWCIVAVPLPPEDDDPLVRTEQFVDQAWTRARDSGAKQCILMMAGAPEELYRTLADQGLFTIVIGAPKMLAVEPGYGSLTPGKTLLLPELNPSGRQFGVCHLQFGGDGSAPTMYHLLLKDCMEDKDQPYPYRQQAKEAWEEHEELVAEQLSTAKIGNP